jgi:outer membrane receptor protein involved in Fe transport
MRTLLLLAFISTSLLAQAQGGRSGGQGENPFKVSGILLDESTGQPLEYATISLLKAADSTLVDGVVTDDTGKFEITGRPGAYILKLQFISYQAKFISVSFNRENRVVDIGRVKLSPDSSILDEVVVTGNKSQMQLELDKRVFNVGEDLANIGSNASEIIDNLPSVSVDVEGNVSLRGSSNVRILVNDKPSGLVGLNNADGLRQLQGDLIERIEVVTNPSARYDAEGSAGIINIILKKERESGFNGSFTANTGYPYNHGFSGNANYRSGSFNLFGSYGIGYRENPGGGFTNRTSFGNDTTYTFIDNDRVRSGISNNFRLGTDFYINEKNIITASGLVRISDEENTTEITYFDSDRDEVLYSNTYRKDIETEDDDNYEYQMQYRRMMKGEGHELTAELQYRDNREVEKSSIDSANLFTNSELVKYQRSINEQIDRNTLIQVDYVYPFGKGKKFEAGYRGTIREIGSDYLVEEVDGQGGWAPLANFSNEFNYNEDVHAAYSIFENKMDKWGYQIGLRAEQTYISTYQRETDDSKKKDYLNFFPSAFLSYKLTKMQTVQASYSRRLSRPRFWYLNPFFSFSDPRNLRAGNTDLNPEFTDSYEMGLLNNFNNSSLYLGAYYRYTTGVIERVKTVYDESQNSTLSIPRNIGTENAYGIEANFNADPLKWLNINGNINFYRAITNGSYEDLELNRDTYSSRFRLNSRVKLGKVDMQVSGNYRAPENTTQGKRENQYSIDLGANMDVMKKNGTLTLSVRDLFNSRKYRGETITDDFIEMSEFQWRSRQIRLSFTYRINQTKKRYRGERDDNSGGDDMEF